MILNETIETDINSLTLDELKSLYLNQLHQNLDLKSVNDDCNQQIYELKRNLQTATAAESYLSQELEAILSSQSNEIEDTKQKQCNKIEELKQKYSNVLSYNTSLEECIENLKKENVFLKDQVESLKQKILQAPQIAEHSSTQNINQELEDENLQLVAKLDQFQEKIHRLTISIAEKDRQIEILKEQVHCLEENLKAKRSEIEDKTNILESTQEQLIELNAELAALKSLPENENRKGNSLFAEVDDQRQALLRRLAAQRKNYLEMKKIYNESEHVIRKLKRENAAMHNELQACTSIFLNAEQLYKNKLNERILQLIKQNEELQKTLSWTEKKLIEMSNNKGVKWLDSMLNYCRNETQDLKVQLHSCRMQKGTLESNLRNSQQELAKWRFEALKFKCIIIDRENLLEENGIKYQPVQNCIFNMNVIDCERATSQILCSQKQNTSENSSSKSTFKDKMLPENLENIKQENVTPLVLHNNIIEEDPQYLNEELSTKDLNIIVKPNDIKADFKDINTELTDKTNKLENDIKFSIYEDTTQILPTIKRSDNTITMNLQEHKKDLNIIENPNDNKADINIELTHKTNNVENDIKFSIYEDTTQNLPTIKRSDNIITMNLQEHSDLSISKEILQEIQQIYPEQSTTTTADSPLSCDSINTTKTTLKSILTPDTDFFQIYEDTTIQIEPIKMTKTIHKEKSLVTDENKENDKINFNRNNYLKQSTVENESLVNNSRHTRCEQNVELPKKSSILVKAHDIIGIKDESKSVKFNISDEGEESNKNKDNIEKNIKATGKKIRTKSNIIIKRITIK